MIKITLPLFILFLSIGYSQTETIEWINKHAHPLLLNTSANTDLYFLPNELKHNKVIGLGEASHGTKEFYDQKARIIQYLVTQLNYKVVGFELSDSICSVINASLQTDVDNLHQIMPEIGLYNTEEILHFFQWMQSHNKKQSLENKVTLFGFDKEEYWYDPLNRDKLMSDNIIKAQKVKNSKTILWAHNVHLAKDTTMARYKAMGSHLKKAFGKSYYVLGFDTYKGTVSIIDNKLFETHSFEASSTSLSAILAEVKYAQFFLSFKTKGNPLKGIKNHITNINSNWQARTSLPIKPGLDFDGLIFIRNTTASTQLVSPSK